MKKKILQKDVEREFLKRKEEADRNWENIMHRINSGKNVSQYEIAHMMGNCNTADWFFLQEKYKKIEREEAEILRLKNKSIFEDI